MVAVGVSDIVGFEIKGPRDRIDDRLAGQLHEYSFYLPEVWLVVDDRWQDHPKVRYHPNLLVVTSAGEIIERKDRSPDRDEMCCSRLIERLWSGEALRVALRLGLVQEQLAAKMPPTKIRNILARLLTGHEIMKQVCIELRARPLVGAGSDESVANRISSGKTPNSSLAGHRP